MVATELLKLAMETDEERKARLKKMVATTQLRLALETEEERRARLEHLSYNPIYISNILYLILIVKVSSLIKLTRSIHFFIIHVCTMYVYKYSVDICDRIWENRPNRRFGQN